MGKQAKKKQKSERQIGNQKNHNRGTRGINTFNRLCVWDKRRVKVDKNKWENRVVSYEAWSMWDWTKIYDAVPDDNGKLHLIRKKAEKQPPLPEPYDMLLSNWEEDLRGYALDWDAQIERTQLENGHFEYVVSRKLSDKSTDVLLTIQSPRNIHFGGRKKFRKRGR